MCMSINFSQVRESTVVLHYFIQWSVCPVYDVMPANVLRQPVPHPFVHSLGQGVKLVGY